MVPYEDQLIEALLLSFCIYIACRAIVHASLSLMSLRHVQQLLMRYVDIVFVYSSLSEA